MKSSKTGGKTTDGISDEEKLNILVEYMVSAEWILPVQSFIDYYCVVFATADFQDHFNEK